MLTRNLLLFSTIPGVPPGQPRPPAGYAYLVDRNGVYLTDASGVYLIGAAS